MKYLLILLIFVCGCSYPVEDSMVIDSVHLHNTNNKYFYTIRLKRTDGNTDYIEFVSNQKFSVGDKVQFTVKED